jgi:hypothetical protein
VGLVGVAQDGSGLAGQRGRDDPVAQDGLGAAAGAEVVRGPADGDLDASGLVGGEQLARHAGAQLALLGVGRVRVGLGQGQAGGAAVHVDVFHADQPGASGLGSGEHAGLQAGEALDPLVVGRVEGLVDDLGALGGGGGEGGVAGVAAEDLDLVGNRGGAGAVDHPYGLAAAAQRFHGGQADRAGPEDHLPWRGAHDRSGPGVAGERVPGSGDHRVEAAERASQHGHAQGDQPDGPQGAAGEPGQVKDREAGNGGGQDVALVEQVQHAGHQPRPPNPAPQDPGVQDHQADRDRPADGQQLAQVLAQQCPAELVLGHPGGRDRRLGGRVASGIAVG